MAREGPRIEGPQTEDGFIQIALELAGAIATAGFKDTELAVLFWVLAQVYGPRKHEAAIASMVELEEVTGIDRKNLARAVRSLESSKVVQRVGRNTLTFNKHYREWTTQRSDRAAKFGPALKATHGIRHRRQTPDASTALGGLTEPPKGV